MPDESDVVVSLNSSTYYTNESMGYVMVCTKIIMGTLERSGSVYLSTMNGTATGNLTIVMIRKDHLVYFFQIGTLPKFKAIQ